MRGNGYAVRRWGDGARAWKGDAPRPVHTRAQIWRSRERAEGQALHGRGGGNALSHDFAYEG